VDDDIVAFCKDELMLVTQGVGCVADQIEQTIATRFDVRAVLDIVGRPIPFSRLIVALVEQVSKASRTRALFSSGVVLGVIILLFKLWVDGIQSATTSSVG
jgi:hypothetical protein